ncbi:PREDICTED: uncharacterized protein LOC107068992 [Polistes dominula]|uniref:Uncharacterized protein LOC107068992 n=1 Tax=Polistes dominula TaxID=743375 RepID=A0ABM1IMD6_POLDO|nr:PREDICTED: uncharacterized protein LOC107068992 [Polistes dominula]
MIRSTIILVVIFIISSVYAQEQEEKYAVSDLKPFLEKFRYVMRTGSESLKVPVLDPHDVQESNYKFDLSFLKADFGVKNLHLTGLSDYQVQEGKLHVAGFNIVLGFHWDQLVVNTEYDINGLVNNKIPIYGKGNFSSILGGVDFSANIRLGFKNNKSYIASIRSTVVLESLNVKATGIFNDEKRSEEISRKITNMGPEFIRKHPNEAGELLSEIAERKLNLVIGNKTLKELLELLNI